MRIGLIAMSGVRVRTKELAELGVTLPQFVNRGVVIASLPSLGLLTVAALTPSDVEVVYREVLASRRRRLSNEHTATAGSMVLVGQVLTKKGGYREAETLLEEALPIHLAKHGLGHRGTLETLHALVTLYEAWGRPDRLAEYRRLLEEAAASVEPGALEESTRP